MRYRPSMVVVLVILLASTMSSVSNAECSIDHILDCIQLFDTNLQKRIAWTGTSIDTFWAHYGVPNEPRGGSGFDAAGTLYTLDPPDVVRYTNDGEREIVATVQGTLITEGGGLAVDLLRGRIYIAIYAGGSNPTAWILELSGLPRLFEIFQSYSAATSSLSFVSPSLPEGLEGADSFDTYYGPLVMPIDFAQAHSLDCGYPVSLPQTGDLLTVADTLADPLPGDGYYFVTAVNYQGQRRYGRKAMGGVLSGRDPTLLPACTSFQ